MALIAVPGPSKHQHGAQGEESGGDQLDHRLWQQTERLTGSHRDRGLHGKRGSDTEPHDEGSVAGGQDKGCDQSLVR